MIAIANSQSSYHFRLQGLKNFKTFDEALRFKIARRYFFEMQKIGLSGGTNLSCPRSFTSQTNGAIAVRPTESCRLDLNSLKLPTHLRECGANGLGIVTVYLQLTADSKKQDAAERRNQIKINPVGTGKVRSQF